MNILELKERSKQYRIDTLKTIYEAKAGHTGGCLSIVDILNVLYNHVLRGTWEDVSRDRYVQSKGHAVETLYVVLSDKGFIPKEELATIGKYKSRLIGHPTKKVPGMEQNTGGLGHGLPICCGTALGAKKSRLDTKVYTVLGDGEMAEGSNWEAMMFASHNKLDNLCAVLDYNKLQITGLNADVMNLEPLRQKIESFGWEVREVNGHDVGALVNAFDQLPFVEGKPSFIIAHTIKGKGVSFMEHNKKWHHGVPTDEELKIALKELEENES